MHNSETAFVESVVREGPAPRHRQLAPLNPNCFVCGTANPSGLNLAFQAEANGSEAVWVPRRAWESFQGIVHGGIITAVLDEAMSKAIIARHLEAFTVDLQVRFRSHISVGEQLYVVDGSLNSTSEGFSPNPISSLGQATNAPMLTPRFSCRGVDRQPETDSA